MNASLVTVILARKKKNGLVYGDVGKHQPVGGVYILETLMTC